MSAPSTIKIVSQLPAHCTRNVPGSAVLAAQTTDQKVILANTWVLGHNLFIISLTSSPWVMSFCDMILAEQWGQYPQLTVAKRSGSNHGKK
jgi:hypothetical protein